MNKSLRIDINIFGEGSSQEIDVVTLEIQKGVVKKMKSGTHLMDKS